MMTTLTDAPFQRGDIVVCGVRHLTVNEGEKVRVIDCIASSECGSGWLVSATKQLRGKLPQRPVIALEGVDSEWFKLWKKVESKPR